ncbi:MAG: hypothetical protein U1E38_05730 [Rhodospirillales bacterium]
MLRPSTETLRAGLLSITLAAIAGCAATNCDPTQGGLVQGIRCDASGGFDTRVKQRQEQQAALLDQQMQIERESQQLEAEQRDVAAQLTRKRAEQQKAEKELAAVRRRLATGQQQNAALQAQAQGLEAEVAKAKADIGKLSMVDQQKRARLADLAREQQNLDKEYKAATGGR